VRLLVDFLCRFGWGLSVALVLTPATGVPGGFFRVNLLVIMGLATLAALVGPTGSADGAWAIPAAAAVLAWMGSVAWYGERRRAGIGLCVATAALLAAATVLASTAGRPWSEAGWPGLDAGLVGGRALVSGLVVGLTVHAMLLGHWYLNAPGMRVDVLRRMIDVALAAWGLQLAVALATIVAARSPGPAVAAGDTTMALAALRWLAGLGGLPVLLVMARKTLDIPNTQSATGILYVACLAAILGELTAQLLSASA
jgi:hypothetical protein